MLEQESAMNQGIAFVGVMLLAFCGWFLIQWAIHNQRDAASKIQEPSPLSPSISPQSGFPQPYAGWKPEDIKRHQDLLRKLGQEVGKETMRNLLTPKPNPIPKIPNIPGLSH
jgi:hypothetical protein